MCVIIHKPKNIEIDLATLDLAWKANSHGAGISYLKNGRINVIKGLMTFDDFIYEYNKVSDLELVIHMRWATHGAILPKFTHPFKVQANFCDATKYHTDLAFHHNGILSKFGTKDFSDSADYAIKILSKIQCLKTMEHILSNESSKFALHSAEGVIIIGEYSLYKGSYYSNNYFLDTWANWEVKEPIIDVSPLTLEIMDDYFDDYMHALSMDKYTHLLFSEYLFMQYGIQLDDLQADEVDTYAEHELEAWGVDKDDNDDLLYSITDEV